MQIEREGGIYVYIYATFPVGDGTGDEGDDAEQ